MIKSRYRYSITVTHRRPPLPTVTDRSLLLPTVTDRSLLLPNVTERYWPLPNLTVTCVTSVTLILVQKAPYYDR